MARVTVIKGDHTDVEIEGEANVKAITLTVEIEDSEPIKAEFEDTAYYAESLEFLAAGNLAEFVSRVKQFVKNAPQDSEVMRTWLREYRASHPEVKWEIGAKGRVPADLQALYRREISKAVPSPDNGNGGRENGEDAKTK